MGFTVIKTGRVKHDDPEPPIDSFGRHHECYRPGAFVRWIRGIHPGGVIRCDVWMNSSQDSAQPYLKWDKYIPICGREWKWTGITWVQQRF